MADMHIIPIGPLRAAVRQELLALFGHAGHTHYLSNP